MTDREIDEILRRAGQVHHEVDEALLDRVGRSMGPALRPVRPRAPMWALAGGVAVVCAAVALAGAAQLGLHGIQRLTGWERALIFPALGILLCGAATASAGETIPGSRRLVRPGVLLGVSSLALLGIFAILFHDYATRRFVPQGLVCLKAGLLLAIPAGVAAWVILRRGFAVNRVGAGLVTGTLAGLAGIAMLELHCPNFEALHVMVWHTAVVPIAGAAGAAMGWLRGRRGGHI